MIFLLSGGIISGLRVAIGKHCTSLAYYAPHTALHFVSLPGPCNAGSADGVRLFKDTMLMLRPFCMCYLDLSRQAAGQLFSCPFSRCITKRVSFLSIIQKLLVRFAHALILISQHSHPSPPVTHCFTHPGHIYICLRTSSIIYRLAPYATRITIIFPNIQSFMVFIRYFSGLVYSLLFIHPSASPA